MTTLNPVASAKDIPLDWDFLRRVISFLDPEMLRERAGLTTTEFKQAVACINQGQPLSCDESLGNGDGDGLTLLGIVPDQSISAKPDAGFKDVQFLRYIRKCCDSLPASYYEAFLRTRFLEQTTREAAADMSISHNTVAERAEKVTNLLREALPGMGIGPDFFE